ncbi:hypothetical protein D3C76_1467260 [compost metagenome]
MDQPGEVLQSHPLAASEAEKRLVILKGDEYSPHGQIPEQDKIEQTGHQQAVQPAVFEDVQDRFPQVRSPTGQRPFSLAGRVQVNNLFPHYSYLITII